MANKIWDNDNELCHHKGTAAAAIVANDMIKRTTTKWTPCSDGNECEAIAVTTATGDGIAFMFTRQNGLRMLITGTLAVNADAYVAGAQAVDGGSAGNKRCGKVDGTDGTNNIVRMHFPDNDAKSHA